MTFRLPGHLACPHCGAIAYPTDQAIRASQGGGSWSTVMYQCSGPGCRRHVPYSPITGRISG